MPTIQSEDLLDLVEEGNEEKGSVSESDDNWL